MGDPRNSRMREDAAREKLRKLKQREAEELLERQEGQQQIEQLFQRRHGGRCVNHLIPVKSHMQTTLNALWPSTPPKQLPLDTSASTPTSTPTSGSRFYLASQCFRFSSAFHISSLSSSNSGSTNTKNSRLPWGRYLWLLSTRVCYKSCSYRLGCIPLILITSGVIFLFLDSPHFNLLHWHPFFTK